MYLHIKNRQEIGMGFIPKEDAVLISITVPESSFVMYNKEYKDVLGLKFHDIDTQSDLLGLKVISKDDVKQIYEFVNKYKNNINHIVVNCDAGQSRSAGVAAALAKILNGDDMEIFKAKPTLNRMVYSRVMSGWRHFGRD